jgi:hypothetical protein
LENLQDDLVASETGKCLFQVIVGRDLSFGDVEENILNLKNVIKVGLVAGAKGRNGVFVACDFESFLACNFSPSVRAQRLGQAGATNTFFHADKADIGQFDLVGGLIDLHGCANVAEWSNCRMCYQRCVSFESGDNKFISLGTRSATRYDAAGLLWGQA